jgi:hypothetical protein
VLNVVLDLPLKFVVVLVSVQRLEVDEKTVLIVEFNQLVLVILVSLKITIELPRVGAGNQFGGTTVEAVAIFGYVRVDVDAMLKINHIVLVIHLRAISANNLRFFDCDQNFVWERDVHETIESASVLFEELGFLYVFWEFHNDHAFLSIGSQSENLKGDFLTDDGISVTCFVVLADFSEEGMVEIGV